MRAGDGLSILGLPALVPHAPPELVIGASPAAGANFTQAVNDGYVWVVLSCSFRVTTDANVANRTARIEYRDPSAIPYCIAGNPVTYPASTTNEDFFFNVWAPLGAWEVASANIGPLPAIPLWPGHDFRIILNNIQAGDTITRVRYIVARFVTPSSDEYPFA